MRSAIIAAALALVIGASATVTTEYGPDGSIRKISKSTSPAPALAKLARSAGGGCSNCHDKCLRGVLSASVADAEFCTSFLAATYSAPADFAPVQTQCASDAGRVSSACSCFVQPTTSESSSAVPTTTSTSSTESSSTPSATPTPPVCIPSDGACTINNFESCCTQCCFFATGDPQDGVCC